MNVIDDLVYFVVWLRSKGQDLESMDEPTLRKWASEFWDMQHGED